MRRERKALRAVMFMSELIYSAEVLSFDLTGYLLGERFAANGV